MRRAKVGAAILISGILGATLRAAPRADDSGPSPLVERIGDTGFYQLEAPSFAKLAPDERILAYYLTQAAIQLDPIFYDQMSWYGLEAKQLLGGMVEHPEWMPVETRDAIVEYAKLFFGNGGNHNETTNRKFLPRVSYQEFAEAAEGARRAGAPLGTAAELSARLQRLHRPLFDPGYEVSITEKNPPPGKDILTASSNTYYEGVTLAELAHFAEAHPLNSRVVRKDGKIVEEIYRAGTPDGKIPPGLYASELRAVDRELGNAARYAEPAQAAVLRALVRYYQTGDPKDWDAFNILWIRNNPPVDFASGFIEVYRDARGAKGSAQMFVSVTDAGLDPLMKKLAENALYFEKREPWADRFKKLDVKPPVGKAIETIAETGDFHVSTIGDNLPNEQDIREKYGTKSVLLTSAIRAFAKTRGARVAAEFSATPEDAELYERYGSTADNLHTAMHEIIGHGSGKVVVPKDPRTYLKEYYSTLEEARADLVAYWNIYDPKLAELGVHDGTEVGHELYRQLARVGLTTLNHYPTGDTAEEDHDRNRLLIVHYIMDTTGAIAQIEKNGHYYLVVRDYDRAHEAVGKLLAEIMRIKAEGDYAAIKALVTKYAIHFDPKVRDDVVARYKALDIAPYSVGVGADLRPVIGEKGEIADIKISYPRDFLKQQLEFARKNGTLGF